MMRRPVYHDPPVRGEGGKYTTLPDMFYKKPLRAECTLPTKAVRAILLDNGGRYIAQGVMWMLVFKHIAAGVYRVTAREDAEACDAHKERGK